MPTNDSLHTNDSRPTIETLYPDLTPEQQAEAAYRIKRYLAVIRRIYERKHGFDKPSISR